MQLIAATRQALSKAHILPCESDPRNILPAYQQRFFDSKHRSSIKLHQYFHHLNSFQALRINLLYPLIVEDSTSMVSEFLGIQYIGRLEACFEKLSTMEKPYRATNFDFHIQDTPSFPSWGRPPTARRRCANARRFARILC
jgi:hypothetical protein